MKKYAKVINYETNQCEVGTGTNIAFYQSIGMTEMEVEQSYNGEWYLQGFSPKKVTTKAELTEFVSAEADKVAYGGFTIVLDEEKYLFKTTTDNITRCNAVLSMFQVLPEDTIIPWEVWQGDTPTMLSVNANQFKSCFAFGSKMIIQVETIKGAINAEIQNLTDEQLANEEFINVFKENVVIQLNSVNTVFDLTSIKNAGE
jgi:hypothetical protein